MFVAGSKEKTKENVFFHIQLHGLATILGPIYKERLWVAATAFGNPLKKKKRHLVSVLCKPEHTM